MSLNPFSHIDLRVRELGDATEFYREFLPAIGFTEQWEGEEWRGNSALGAFPSKPFFGFTEDPNHQPNGTRIAFWVNSSAEVDRVAEIIQRPEPKTSKAHFLTPNTTRPITPCSLMIRAETALKSSIDRNEEIYEK